ncbi:hypothetical protein GC194_06995 [bacterium]|nr:hypothetical protein [bacterium]
MSSKHIAVIDLGSNTFHLLIKGIDAFGQGFDLFSKQSHVRMAEGGLRDKKILPEAFARGIKCLKDYKELIDELGVDSVIAFGTSVFRDAVNVRDFLQEGSRILDHNIEIISGRREAELIFNGVINAFKPNSKPYAILDIGGGSIEIIIGQRKKLLWCESLPLGALRLAKAFHYSDPISKSEIEDLRKFLTNQLAGAMKAFKIYKPKILIGAAGCFETLSKMEHVNLLNEPFPEFSRANEIELKHFEELASLILQCNKSELLDIPGMDDFRSDLMTVSVILIEEVLKLGKFSQLMYSDYSMKEGIFFEFLSEAAN